MQYIIMDLEWNGSYSKKIGGYFNEIIEIGAVKLDKNLSFVDSFSLMIKPRISPKLSTVVRNLTNIRNEELNSGCECSSAISRFKKWIRKKDSVILTWGNSDLLVLLQNCKYFFGADKIPFLDKFVDLQQYTQKHLGMEGGNHLGLSKASEILKVEDENIKLHRALDDSMLSAAVLKKIFSTEELLEHLVDASTPQFYERLLFKTKIITDIQNPLVIAANKHFYCPECNTKMSRQVAWKFKNKQFRSEFLCSECDRTYEGKMLFKMEYEGLVIKRSIIEKLSIKIDADKTAPIFATKEVN